MVYCKTTTSQVELKNEFKHNTCGFEPQLLKLDSIPLEWMCNFIAIIL